MTVKDNDATQDGGGIWHGHGAGALTATSSTVSGNTATGDDGGGIWHGHQSDTLTVTSSTVSGNKANGDDGGVDVRHDRTAIITNSTVSGNRANGHGGGISSRHTDTTVNLNNVTVTNDTADFDNTGGGDGGGLHTEQGGTINVKNSIIAGNNDPTSAPDCSTDTGTGDSTVSHGYNLVGKSDGCNWTNAAGDQVGTIAAPLDPQLGALGDNRGPTQTHALLSGSPAIDAALDCTTVTGQAVTEDQRGAPRPMDGNGDGTALCDIGAYEAPPPPPPMPVGGIVVPVSRLELVAPWLGLAALVSLAALTVALVRRRRA